MQVLTLDVRSHLHQDAVDHDTGAQPGGELWATKSRFPSERMGT
jgi:hypothetical protein